MPANNSVGSGTVLPGTVPGSIGGGSDPTLTSMSGTGGFLGALYGQIPGVANPISSAATATTGNRQNLTNIDNLTQGADTISATGAALPFEINLPGYEGMLQTATGNTGQELQGQVPQDVQNLLAEQSAERGVSTGEAPGSPNTNAAYLQALGLTSLGQEQQGQTNLSQLIGETPTGASYNPASSFVTPAQQQDAAQAVQTAQAAPDPALSGLISALTSFI